MLDDKYKKCKRELRKKVLPPHISMLYMVVSIGILVEVD